MSDKRGFTIIEVLVAVMVMSIGLLGLVTTAGLVTRMIGQGERFTNVAALANERIEILRARHCPAVGTGTETRGNYVISWEVTDVAAGRARGLQVVVNSPTGRGTRVDTVRTVQVCP